MTDKKRVTRTGATDSKTESNGLNFGTHSGIQSFSVSEELKSRRALAGGAGNCTIVDSSVQDNKDEDGNVISHKLKLFFDGVKGGGAIDVLTTQSPTFFKKGIARLKYLLAVADIAFPDSCKDAIIVANQNEDNEAYKLAKPILEAYTAEHGADAFMELFSITEDGSIVLTRQGAFRDIFLGTGVQMIYAESDLVVEAQRERDNKLYELRTSDAWKDYSKEDKTTKSDEIKEEYNETLNELEVVLCVCNMEAFDDMTEAVNEIPEDVIFHIICLKGNNSQAGKYSVAK